MSFEAKFEIQHCNLRKMKNTQSCLLRYWWYDLEFSKQKLRYYCLVNKYVRCILTAFSIQFTKFLKVSIEVFILRNTINTVINMKSKI